MVRPREKDREVIRNVRVTVLVRADERKRWEARANADGETLSQWLRRVANRAVRTG